MSKALRAETALPLTPDTPAAIEFLQRFRPGGPWVLTAIIPDGKTVTQTFTPETVADARGWIDAKQGKLNIYFHVNPTKPAYKHGQNGEKYEAKATKEDVLRLDWLHVDIDPRAGEDIEEERERALKVLREFDKPPTVIIDSGGGIQAFWKLEEEDDELQINGVVAKAEELERYNQQLEIIFQGDHCHNCDRIMRLPGTINVPNKKKLRKGRVPVLATLLEWHDDRVYPISKFTPAVRVQSSDDSLPGARPKIKITGNVPDIGTEELKEWASENGKSISDHTLALIATGADPLDPNKYASRSETLFRVCCDLVRAEVPDEMIYAVITGSNEIAASVRDKPNWESYALRQIERAHEEAVDPWLRKLNEKYAVIGNIGGKCRIITEAEDRSRKDKRVRITKQSFEDFRNYYRNRKVVVGMGDNGQPIEKAVGAWWLDHPLRRQYETLVFAPGQEVGDAYNLWQGFACDSIPGNQHESFLHHVKNNVCSGNEEWYEYLVGWMARAVQEPDSPGEVAVVLRGKRGTGKSFFAKVLGHLFGRHFLQVSDSKHLVGSFNAHLRDTVLLFGDEAFFAGDKKHESVLKTLITEESLIVEGKGVDAEAAANFTHLILASNDSWVVPAGLDERRFFVLEIGDGEKQNHRYFKAIKNDLESGGFENLLYFLLTYDLNDFEVRAVPQTEALIDQKAQSLQGFEAYLFDLLKSAEPPPGAEELRSGVLFVPTSEILKDAKGWMQGRPGWNHITHSAIRKVLIEKLDAATKHRKSGGANGYLWDLSRLRAAWSKEMFPVKWPPVPEDYYKPPARW